VYIIFKRTGDGLLVDVATRNELDQAAQIVEAFDLQWPGEYVVRDLEGNVVYSTELGAPSPGAASIVDRLSRQRLPGSGPMSDL
jgi:hypothetical protein